MSHPFVDEDIIRFVRGEMTGAELIAFENELDSNQTLTDEVKEVQLAISVIDRRGEKLLKQRFKKLETRNSIKKWIYILLATVSVLILGLVIKKQFTKVKPAEPRAIYADNFQKYRPPVTIRNNSNPSSGLSSAIEAYNSGNYEEAFRHFDLACNEVNQEACFYAVLSAIYRGDSEYQNAKNAIVNNSPYSAIIIWNEGLYHLNNNNVDQAIVLLRQLVELGTYKKDEALKILNELQLLEK